MESNWRWNVAEKGWSHYDVRLLARVTLPIIDNWWISDQLIGGRPVVFLFDPDYGEIRPYFVTDRLVPGANFPYGFPVLPDHP